MRFMNAALKINFQKEENRVSEFSQVQKSLIAFFETKVQKSDLFKARDKADKKAVEVEKSNDKDRAKKETQLRELQLEQREVRKEALRTVIPEWLTECAEKAISVAKPMLKASHPVKFSHGVIPYSGIYIESVGEKSRHLTTASLNNRYFDVVMSNGNLITHGRFLMSPIDKDSVYEKLENNDDAWLSEFSKNEDQVATWASGLKNWLAFDQQQIPTSRLKQNFFPVDDGYHLLSPLFSSVLCQKIYEKARYDKDNARRKKARKNEKYAEGETFDLPNMAIMNFGGSQHQNISVGNFERRGEAYLLPCAAPSWVSDFQLPVNASSLYEGEFDRRAWRLAKQLQRYLVSLHKQRGNKEIRDQVKRSVDEIIDVLLNYVAQVQNLESKAGWTREAEKLKASHKLWLDPYRSEQSFQDVRRAGDWRKEVCSDFGQWLNKKLEHKTMVFEKVESSFWAKRLKAQLREFERGLEVKQ